jgi:hypothetical protein
VWVRLFVDEGVAKGSGANQRTKNSESIRDFVWDASAIFIVLVE